MNWDRIQSLELELAQLRARLTRVDNLNLNLLVEVETLTAQRDTARRIAMRLEEECHDLALELETAPLDQDDVVRVALWGEAT
jgi:hypothetical protein